MARAVYLTSGSTMFQVRDHAPHAWFLLEDCGVLFLDVNCDHGAFGYSWMIELNADELERYRAEGRSFLDELADAIHMSVPVVVGSTSAYKDRNVSKEHSGAIQDAIRRWRARETAL
jgi:hypothetical protein